MQPKKKQKVKLKAQPGCMNCFVNCARWRGSTLAIYKTVKIIFPLNLQTITITLDVSNGGEGVKWPVDGFWRTMAQNALWRKDVPFGVHMMADNIFWLKFPKNCQ